MNSQKPLRRAMVLVSIGLLLVVSPLLLREFVILSDFFRGLLTGIGISLEIVGLVLVGRAKKAVYGG